MPRYIDADAIHYVEVGKGVEIALASDIDKIPTLSPDDARPVGKWIKYAPDNSDMLVCSECEKYWILDGDQYDFRYCPNCGARLMNGGTNDS